MCHKLKLLGYRSGEALLAAVLRPADVDIHIPVRRRGGPWGAGSVCRNGPDHLHLHLAGEAAQGVLHPPGVGTDASGQPGHKIRHPGLIIPQGAFIGTGEVQKAGDASRKVFYRVQQVLHPAGDTVGKALYHVPAPI